MEGKPGNNHEEEIRQETSRFLEELRENLHALEQSPAVKVSRKVGINFIAGQGHDDKIRPNVFISDEQIKQIFFHPDVKLCKILEEILETNKGQDQ